MAIGLEVPESGRNVMPGIAVAAVVVCRDDDPGMCIVGILDSLVNETGPVSLVMPALMGHVQRAAEEVGLPKPRTAYAVDANGRVDCYSASGKPGKPVVVMGWPNFSVDAMVRHHAMAPYLWMEMVRFAETHMTGLVDPQRVSPAKLGLAFERKDIARAASFEQMHPSAGMGATIIEGQSLYGATIVGVAVSGRAIALKRDLLLDLSTPANLISVGNYATSCYAQTEVFVRNPDSRVWVKRGGLGEQSVLVGTRLCSPAAWRLDGA